MDQNINYTALAEAIAAGQTAADMRMVPGRITLTRLIGRALLLGVQFMTLWIDWGLLIPLQLAYRLIVWAIAKVRKAPAPQFGPLVKLTRKATFSIRKPIPFYKKKANAGKSRWMVTF